MKTQEYIYLIIGNNYYNWIINSYLKRPVFISKVHKCKVNSVYWNPYKQATLITTDESGTVRLYYLSFI